MCAPPRAAELAVVGMKNNRGVLVIMCELKPFFVVNPWVSGHLVPAELPRRIHIERLLHSINNEIFICEVAAWGPGCLGPKVALLLEGLHVPEDSRDLAAMSLARLAKSHVENRLRLGRRIVLCGLHRGSDQRLRVEVWVDGQDLCAYVSRLLSEAVV